MIESTGSATAVSILGTGAIGGKIAQTMLAAGTTVTVWNRTPERTDALAARGSARAPSAAEAVAASPLVLVCVTDYAAVDAVLEATADTIAGRTIVALTTGSPAEAHQAAHKAEQAGAAYLDGGVQTEPENIGSNAATFLYSGPRSAFEEHRATLETLGSAQYLGADPAAAAVQDLTLFGLWYDAQVAYLRALETIRSTGIDVEDFAPLAATQLGHVVHATAGTAHEVKTRSFPRGPADLTEHGPVLEQLIELRRGQHLGNGALDHIHHLVQQRIELGHGREGLTTIIE
ncbi:6-phosphogluconate dehydrogenase-like protein [Halopolyspora algeriensis]|uniref:6-phosphogluconate dehydrogenase-like protein n=1 Tax=Halopolyspora algeriensis TaxID=1500506 RepID=A0A368VYC7_9ACTN|nr:NAD(P)-binding domain-containing protein [Halopolyspora algeriensis]RCW46961.1 6-phosphogluconate dehydrogenase-like protein [Halopolyspora algeriensis]TQM48052.1 6-phosphogluconate dehydrogenase-like protein [Halopolyspora algeriensis]